MSNPITDGQLRDHGPPFVERVLGLAVAMAVAFVAYRLGVLSWPRIRSVVPGVILMSTLFVWFPDHIASWLPDLSATHSDLGATVVRTVGWAILVFLGVFLGAALLVMR